MNVAHLEVMDILEDDILFFIDHVIQHTYKLYGFGSKLHAFISLLSNSQNSRAAVKALFIARRHSLYMHFIPLESIQTCSLYLCMSITTSCLTMTPSNQRWVYSSDSLGICRNIAGILMMVTSLLHRFVWKKLVSDGPFVFCQNLPAYI